MATKNTRPPKPSSPPEESVTSTPPSGESVIAPSSKSRNIKVTEDQRETTDTSISPAKAAQEQSITPQESAKISVTLRTEQSYEYNLDLPRAVVENILDPDVPDGFIEVPAQAYGGQRLHGTRRFLHTAFIKEVDVRGLE